MAAEKNILSRAGLKKRRDALIGNKVCSLLKWPSTLTGLLKGRNTDKQIGDTDSGHYSALQSMHYRVITYSR